MLFFNLLQFSDLGLFILRLAVGVIFIYHALPKLKSSKMMAKAMGMPSGMILMLGTVEFVSALGLILGVYTQIAALLLGIIMAGAIMMKKMKWSVKFAEMEKTGWEFDLALLAANVAILLTGGGSVGILY